jgi:hypothetical protein
MFQRLISWRRKQHVPPKLCCLYQTARRISREDNTLYSPQPWGRHFDTFTSNISFFRSWQLLGYSNSPHFVEPQLSFPCSQELANFVHPEQDKFNSCPRLHPISWRSTLIVSSHLSRDLSSDLFRSGLRTKNHVCVSPLPKTLHTTCVSRLFGQDHHLYATGWRIQSVSYLCGIFIKRRQVPVAERSQA